MCAARARIGLKFFYGRVSPAAAALVMKKPFLIVEFALLLLCVACGSSNSVPGGGGVFQPQGGFSKASLSGQYAFELVGTTGSDLVQGGTFTADGNGNITTGVADFVTQGASSLSNAITGTYTVGNDGTGFINATILGQQFQYAITIVNASKVYMTESDGGANASGVAEAQSAATMTTVPSGTFAFRLHNLNSLKGSMSSVGAFTLTSGTLSSGAEDVLFLGGATNSLTFSGGAFNAPTSGRGSGTLVDSNGTLSFEYYVLDANHVDIVPTSSVGYGRAEMQSGGPFSKASLSGGYAFGSQGDTLAEGSRGVQTAGIFTADGNDNISAGTEDITDNGNTAASDPSTGTYTLASNGDGRADVNLSSTALGSVHKIFWLVNSSRAFFLTDDPNQTEDGTIDAQQSTTFSNSTLNGQFGASMSGFDLNAGAFVDRIGALNFQSNGNLTFNFVEIDSGGLSNAAASGTYSVASNGRVSAAINNISNNVIIYLISGNDGYVIQNDAGVVIGGTMSKQ